MGAWWLGMPASGPELPLPEGRAASEEGEAERDVRPAVSAGFPMERRTVSKVRSIFFIDRERISCFLSGIYQLSSLGEKDRTYFVDLLPLFDSSKIHS